MKTLGARLLTLTTLSTTLALAQAANAAGVKDIVDTAVSAGSFDTLAAALTKADLIDTLKGPGPFTVFAPTDDAFAALPAGVLDDLLRPKNRAQLVGVLTYHVVPGEFPAARVTSASRAATVLGERLDVRIDGGVKVDNASVVKADIRCSNGIIHVIDRVLIPASQSIVDTLQSRDRFSTLLAAAKAAGLAEALAGDGPFTVFAPTNEAFAALPKGTVERLLQPASKGRLAAILRYHVVPGRVYSDQAVTVGSGATLLEPGSLSFGISGGRLQVAGADIVENDIELSNGVIHVIDRVLLPSDDLLPDVEGRKVIGIYQEAPGKALSTQLGLDRHASMLVTGFAEGSTAQAAGMKQYDVIVRVDGDPATSDALDRAKQRAGIGGSVALELLRAGERVRLHVPVGVAAH